MARGEQLWGRHGVQHVLLRSAASPVCHWCPLLGPPLHATPHCWHTCCTSSAASPYTPLHTPPPPQAKGKAVQMTVHDDRSLLALQGPAAVEALQALTKADLSKQYFSSFHTFEAAGVPIWATRTG